MMSFKINWHNYNWVLFLGIGLMALSLIGPRVPQTDSISVTPNITTTFEEPSDPKLLELSRTVTASLKGSGPDGLALASLYNDLATLIEINQDIIKNTEEIREANRIGGHMLKLGIKDKYPNLGSAANTMVVSYIGDDNVALSPELRKKSVDVFRALAWACYKGSN